MTQPRTDGPVIVAAAVVDGRGRVLVGQRSYPVDLAGYWEFPGGKVEPGESDEDALRREYCEELGVGIVLDDRIRGDWPIMDGHVLRLWTAHLAGSAERPCPTEHAALEWVEPDALHLVDWLPSDLAVTAELQALLLGETERPLAGGNVGGAVRVGRTVRRPCGPWTPAVHAYMRYVSGKGVPGVPQVLGVDDRGREVLEYLHGDVTPSGPWEPWALTDRYLTDVGSWLATLHAAAVDFPADGRCFRFGLGAPGPGELVCHNDVGPYNTVGQDGRLAGVLDWDVVGPAPPVWDVAYAAWGFALGNVHEPVADRGHRLRMLCQAYGVDSGSVLAAVEPRVGWMVEVARRAAADGDEGMRHLVELGEMDKQAAALATFRDKRAELAAAALR